ncbi:MAG TPA: glucoamylase family protein, partial [Pyrinomonadaceae bacterium]
MSELLESFVSFLRNPARNTDEKPFQAEFYSVERLEQYAQTLAAEHKTVTRKGRALLLPRLAENGRILEGAYRALVEALRQGRAISPAAEWLVDNYHIVEEQLREIRHDLPKSYYHELPKLAEGELSGYPRIYAVALALITHTDSRLDTNTLRRFIAAYQTVSPLSIGELWAVAITLRLALVENLRRLAISIARARLEREEADKLADKLLELASLNPTAINTVVSERLGKREELPQSFVVELVQRLREQHPSVMPVMDWLEKHLGKQGASVEQIIHNEHQRQAAAQVTVGNIITSMRLLSTLDWNDFFEKVSLIEPVLGKDPVGVYSRMEFSSRDRYRHVVERISKRTSSSELQIAEAAVNLATEVKDGDEARKHVGYYFIDEGLPQLEAKFGYRPRFGEKLRRSLLRRATLTYLGTISVLAVLLLAFPLIALRAAGANWIVLLVAVVVGLVPASDLALTVINWDLTHFFPPRLLPRIATTDGIPEDAVTFVVVPTIFFSELQVHELVERLEVHFLANQDQRIYYALLGDFRDAEAEEMPNDSPLLSVAQSGIDALNQKHGEARFHLFHRRRLWNAGENKWMGWERKRGKLEEFNRLLRGARDTSFVVRTADDALMKSIRYVITLDTDTQLPRDVARKLVGAAEHPLNRPRFDESNVVVHGYGILQPRVSISLSSASRSRFAQIFAGYTGIDPYTTAVSDVYQDLFGEGNFTGKGLYEVDAFQRALNDRVPENALLSHDLFECLFARAALVTDIELVDEYPASYEAFAKRLHRWTRGDWQIVHWLFPRVPNGSGQKVRNSLPLIARWKIFDNLRRSLVAPSLFLWIVAACTIFPHSALLWSLFVLIEIAFPVHLHVTTGLLTHPRGVGWSSHFSSLFGDFRINTAQIALMFVFLPHQAYLMCDAIVRTLYRQLVSHKKLLEWVSAAEAERTVRYDLVSYLRFLWPAEILALAALGLTVVLKPAALPFIGIVCGVWIASPFIALWASKPRPLVRQILSAEDVKFARQLARRTWRFFETFVGKEDNWLPPDNYQEDPEALAHRTSPTNIGLLLLATSSVHELGYVSTLELVERVELTFATMAKLGRLHGHFFNWYDTKTLEPLTPQYISTVDSGNLAGHLIAVKQGAIELPDDKLFGPHVVDGITDTLDALASEATSLGSFRQRTDVVTVRQLQDEIAACRKLLSEYPGKDLSAWFRLIDSLARGAAEIDDIVNALAHEHGEDTFKQLQWWVRAFRNQVKCHQRDAESLTTWGRLLPELKQAIGASEDWAAVFKLLQDVPTLAEVPQLCDKVLVQLSAFQNHDSPQLAQVSGKLTKALEQAAGGSNDLLSRLSRIARTCDQFSGETDFSFLFDVERKLFTIGFNASASRADDSYYDLLASEARLASFVGIAKGDVPQQHWFRMGRALTKVDGGRALLSWTGTMFEYLMPLLVMRNYEQTLLAETYETVVDRQIEYGQERGVPWGISEAAYNVRDLQLNYQYGPFGVPGLGLKRGLVEDLVVAPYATLLAAAIEANAAMSNLHRLEKEGAFGAFGFYEAIDYTRQRVPDGQKSVLIRAFMTHHQGMSLVALTNLLRDDVMERRFHSDPAVQATELLLQERIPVGVPAAHPRAEEVLTGRVMQFLPGMVTRVYESADLETPRTHLLSNGTYNVMLTTAGSGYSHSEEFAVTRWREDVTRDNWGCFIYLRDVRSGMVWSAGYQPVKRRAQAYTVAFSEDKADFRRIDSGISTRMEVVVSAEDNAEVRRISLTNHSSRTREIELTSYAEVVLNTPGADDAHQA